MNGKTLPELKKEKHMREIIDRALDCIEKYGYEATTIDMICEDILISKRTFFNYFGSKEGLLYRMVEIYQDIYIEKAEEAFDEENPLDSLRTIIGQYVYLCRRTLNTTKAFWSQTLINDEFMELRRRGDTFNLEIAKRAYAAAGRELAISDESMFILASGTMREVVISTKLDDCLETARKWANHLIDTYSRPIK